jgi:hypothetical protein
MISDLGLYPRPAPLSRTATPPKQVSGSAIVSELASLRLTPVRVSGSFVTGASCPSALRSVSESACSWGSVSASPPKDEASKRGVRMVTRFALWKV